MFDEGEFKSINSPQISKKEEKTLNKIVDLLLQGKRIRNIASCMFPKLDYILNLRLQDALNRGFHQTVSVLERHIKNLNEISQMRTYFQSSKIEREPTDGQNAEQYANKTNELTNKILVEMQKMSIQEQEQYLLQQEREFDEMEEFYRRKKREIDVDFNSKRNLLLRRFRTERKELYDTFLQKKKHFRFSKSIEDKRALILILKQRNRLLTTQTLTSPYTSLSKKDLKEADIVSEATIQKHEEELQQLMKMEKREHDDQVEALYNDNLTKMIEKQKEISMRMMQFYEFRKNENDKSRKRDISEILLVISIIKSNIGTVSSPSKQLIPVTEEMQLSPISAKSANSSKQSLSQNEIPSKIADITPLSPITEKKQYVSIGNQTNSQLSVKMTPVETLSTSAIRAFEEEEENIEPKRFSLERSRSLSKQTESRIIEFNNAQTQTMIVDKKKRKNTGTATTQVPSQQRMPRRNRSASVSNAKRRSNHKDRNATFTPNYDPYDYHPQQRRMPSYIPEFTRKFKSTIIPPSFGYADMHMITSVEDENGFDYSALYPMEPDTELEVTTTLTDLTRHKFY